MTRLRLAIIVLEAVFLVVGCGLLCAFYGLSLLFWAATVLALLVFVASQSFSDKPEVPEKIVNIPAIPAISTHRVALHQARMKYAWDWFQYHADQRLKAFNFFLVILGLFVGVYGAAMKESIATSASPYATFAAVVALCGAIISIAFLLIEIRNTELVECGRRWLDILENGLGMRIRQDDRERVCLHEAVGSVTWPLLWFQGVVLHRFWTRAIYGVAFVGFVSAFAWALCSQSTARPPDKVADVKMIAGEQASEMRSPAITRPDIK